MPGQLFVVGTPIGNLSDITLRAVETLKASSHIFAEDTRHTKLLLGHIGATGKKVIALHAHTSERALATAIEILEEGAIASLVTDAGMPGVSDPGAALVRAARTRQIPISIIPGPSAVTSAIALSGLGEGGFVFLGFLPRKGRKRSECFSAMARSHLPHVIFESPHRVSDTLRDLMTALPDRTVVLCRELTKKFEEVESVELASLSAEWLDRKWLGEFTLVISGSTSDRKTEEESTDHELALEQLLAEGESPRAAAARLLSHLASRGEHASKRELYQLALDLVRRRAESPFEGETWDQEPPDRTAD